MRARYSLIAIALLLAGCAPEPLAAEPTPPGPAPTATFSATAAPVTETFAMPTLCSQILPASRVDAWLNEGIVLLGGPDGKYGDDYLAEPSPEQELGGITCIWGPSDSENSSVTISVAPLGASTRAAVVKDLAVNQGLNEEVSAAITLYWQHGDTELEPAILNVLRADSWISIIQTLGGTASFAEAEDLADEVHTLVYTAG